LHEAYNCNSNETVCNDPLANDKVIEIEGVKAAKLQEKKEGIKMAVERFGCEQCHERPILPNNNLQ
jgi:hypothetical protein